MINDPDDTDTIIAYGGAKPGDGNFADVLAIDGDIVEVIAERERRRKEKQCAKNLRIASPIVPQPIT
jgi:hypothetical protein